jgi:hypothetical protein
MRGTVDPTTLWFHTPQGVVGGRAPPPAAKGDETLDIRRAAMLGVHSTMQTLMREPVPAPDGPAVTSVTPWRSPPRLVGLPTYDV